MTPPLHSRIARLFKKRNSATSTSNQNELTALAIPGVIDCFEAADGDLDHSANNADTNARVAGVAVAVPTVRAVPVELSSSSAAAAAARESREDEEKSPPQSKLKARASDPRRISDKSKNMNLKEPPEILLASPNLLGSKLNKVAASGSSHSQPSSSESEGSESVDSSDSDDGSIASSDDDSIALEDIPLKDLNLCPVEYDHASSDLSNKLKHFGAKASAMDDRKPAAKPAPRKSIDFGAAAALAVSESSTAKKHLADGGVANKLECPTGMSQEVFYQLPPDMQREVTEQQQRHDNRLMRRSDNNQTLDNAGRRHDTTMTADIDPETLASLPNNIRKEVLEQARREQQQPKEKAADRRPLRKKTGKLSQSTAAYLGGCDIDLDDFYDFPEEVKDDILEQRRLDKEAHESQNAPKKKEPVLEDSDLDLSGYDPETLASLPEDVRKEVLDDERRQREKRNRSERKKPSSVVGAHSVNVPAGYDPDTFEALPKDVQQDLRDDARQVQQQGLRYSAEGYDSDRIVTARVVQAQSAGGASPSCTYTGEYNIMGKRHGDGELKWANGDTYAGKFNMGYIEGRGTINFHDGTEYAGQWKGNRFHGMGTRRFKNGNVYTGNYAAGKRQGQGRCYFANGDLYVGDWKADTIHGFGRYYYSNGHSFEGMFRNGKRNGRGKYQLTDGRVEIYRYVDDSRVGDGVRWSKSRKKAWRMNDGKVTKRVSIEEAVAIAKRCGPVVEES